MTEGHQNISLPTREQIVRAIEIYLSEAYAQAVPERVTGLLPRDKFIPSEYLMSDRVERGEGSRMLSQVRSFALRLGNSVYPNMKLRITRATHSGVYVFTVDCHDAILQAPAGSADDEALAELKHHNAQLAARIESAWDEAGLPTEKSLLRQKIRQAKERKR